MVDIIGKTEEEAERVLTKQGKKLRVAERDGEPYLLTCDYWSDRINVAISGGKIIQIVGIG